MLDARPLGIGILYTQQYSPGQQINHNRQIQNGDNAILEIKGKSVLVRNIVNKGQGKYSGIIYGFESLSDEYEGLKLEQEIEFEEKHTM